MFTIRILVKKKEPDRLRMLNSVQKKMKSYYIKVRNFVVKYERHMSSAALIFGFILDNLTLRRVDLLVENLAIVGYLTVAAVCIIFLNLSGEAKIFGGFLKKIHPWLLIGMQFAFGGLFSAFLIFYSRSASLASSWPFLAILLAHLVGNELSRKRYVRSAFQISVFYIAVFSYLIFLLPLVTGKISEGMFLLSGVASIAVIIVFYFLLRRLAPIAIANSGRPIMFSILGIYVAVNFLYFARFIPPIPLALKSAGVYDLIEKNSAGDYVLMKEERDWKDRLRLYPRIDVRQGEPVYAYSAIFAPVNISIPVYHRWEYFDKTKNRWIESSLIRLDISGGRNEGYRTYSMKYAVFPSLWRVTIETPSGHIIGRMKFFIRRLD